ncbi:MAG: hypothetical protein ACWA5L_01925 [bacterium]
MIRIILPLAVVASLLFAPLQKVTQTIDDGIGNVTTSESAVTAGDLFLKKPYECAMSMKFDPRMEECAPNGGFSGWSMYAAAASSAVAGILGILGLLPFVGRLTSIVTTAAGGISTAAIGKYIFALWQGGNFEAMQWGGWLAGGLGLLTLISGFSGIGGDD